MNVRLPAFIRTMSNYGPSLGFTLVVLVGGIGAAFLSAFGHLA